MSAPVAPTKQLRKEHHYKIFKNPPETFVALGEAANRKAAMLWYRVLILGILAGFFIGIGGAVSVSAAGGIVTSNTSFTKNEIPALPKLVSGATFPIGLVLVVVMGAELFTGNAMIMSLGILAGKVSWKGLAINWGLSYLGNYIGTLIMALIMWGTGAYATGSTLTYIQNLAFAKTYDNWGVLMLKAIPCNVLVCSAVTMAVASEDIASKILAIYVAIFTFIVAGFEHSIANMFYITTGIFHGSAAGYGDFLWRNLLPVTLGNIVGAVLVLSVPYWATYYVVAAPKQEIQRRGTSMFTPDDNKDKKEKPLNDTVIEMGVNSKASKSGNGSSHGSPAVRRSPAPPRKEEHPDQKEELESSSSTSSQ